MRSNARIVVMDRHDLVRVGLRGYLAPLAGVTVVADFDAPAPLLPYLRAHAVDVLVLDCFQREHDGQAERLLAQLQRLTAARVVVFTAECSASAHAMCKRASAYAFIDKRTALDEVVDTLRNAALSRPGPPRDDDAAFLQAGLRRLSVQEFRVLGLVARGMGTAQISDRLARSRSTISTHKWNALGKLQVGSELEFLRLLPPDFQWPETP